MAEFQVCSSSGGEGRSHSGLFLSHAVPVDSRSKQQAAANRLKGEQIPAHFKHRGTAEGHVSHHLQCPGPLLGTYYP